MKLKNIFGSMVAASLALLTTASCQKAEEVMDTLSVSPDKTLILAAKDNADVTLNVTTNVETWEFTAPEWITGTKNGNALVLKIADNTVTEERFGRITITAGKASPVKIAVQQAAAEESEPVVPSGVQATIVADTQMNIYMDKEFNASLKVKMTVAEPAAEEMQAKLIFDAEHLSEFVFVSGKDVQLFPEQGVNLENAVLTIEKGQTESAELDLNIKGNADMQNGVGYLVPILAQPVKNVSFTDKTERADFIVVRKNLREVKNVLYFEVNDVNPLNALEYVLEDGTPFYDAVILFAANINYDSSNDVVYLHNNPNVQALLDQTETYLQPLRKAGIKVYLGLLGNHDAAGLCQLSDWGAEQWAKEVAQACREYKLDGVNLDDEYSSSPLMGNHWFTSPSGAAGSRLCYELKKALKEECYWPTEVSYFAWGSLYQCSNVKDQHTGVEYQPKDFIDFYVANYGGSTSPYGGLTMKQCSAQSFELNRGYGSCSVEAARGFKEQGYGWVMWFAFNPCPGSHTENRRSSVSIMNNVAQGLYDMKLKPEQHYYRKIGEGEYDPKPYKFE